MKAAAVGAVLSINDEAMRRENLTRPDFGTTLPRMPDLAKLTDG
jgi:hypothetical protein